MSGNPPIAAEPGRRGSRVRLLIPHEHGAWFMLLCPFAIGLGAAPAARAVPAALLAITLTALYLARNAADLALRPRHRSVALPWLAGYGAVGIGAGLGLLGATRASSLVVVAGAAAALYIVHVSLRRTRARLDRTVWGELLGVGALCLGLPAGIVVGGGRLGAETWALWALCCLFFGSSVYHVRGLLEAAKVRGEFCRPDHWRIGRPGLMYHVVAAFALAAIAELVVPRLGGTVWLSVAPAYLRAAIGLARLNNRLPRLAVVGIGESLCAVWFTVVVSLAAR